VTLWANATVGSSFTGWYGALSGTDVPETLTITGNMDVTATFIEATPPTVTLNTPLNDSTIRSTTITFNVTANDNTNLKNATLYLGSTEIIQGNISVRVSTSSDDAEENIATGGVHTTDSTDLELGYDDAFGPSVQIVGTRFNNIQIPPGAIITNAYVEFECDVGNAGPAWTGDVLLQITGQDIDNAPTFTTTEDDISSRTDTTAVVPWTITAEWTVDSKYPSLDISSIIQQVVDRPGWSSGNSMVIMFTALSETGTNRRETESYSGEATAAPLLVVNYTIAGGIAWNANQTKTISGTTNTTTFTVTLPEGEYEWNVLAYDEAGNSAFAPQNFTLTVNTTIPPIYYTLTTSKVGNGTITPSSGSTYLNGTVVDVEAIPDPGWEFTSWSGNLTGNDNSTTITMDGNKTITATFTEIPPVYYILTINKIGSGTVTPASGNSYLAGTTVNVEAIPDPDWKFNSWSGGLSGTDNSTTITMNSNKTITATFLESLAPTVTLNTPTNNSTVRSPSVSFNVTCNDNTNLKNATLYYGSVGGGGGGAITLVQQKTYAHPYPSTQYGISVTLDTAATANNLLITGVAIDKNSGTITVPTGFTIIQKGEATDTGQSVSGALAYKVATGGETTISWSWTVNQEGSVWIGEYSGLKATDVLDVSTENETYMNNHQTTTISTGTTPTTTQANELAIALFAADSGVYVGTTHSWTNGFTIQANITSTSGSPYLNIANKTLNTIGTVESTFTHNYAAGEDSYAMVATFKILPSGTIWHAQETKTISGTTNTMLFTITLPEGAYKWNVLAYDEAGNYAFAPSNYTVTVNTTIPPVYYTLTTNVVGNGVVTPASGSSYLAGTVVDVEARPNIGWRFDHWNGNLTGTDNTTTITMDSNKTINATFTELPPIYYILTINKVGSGIVTPASGNSYLAGTVVPVEAIPDTGWQFSSWSGNLSGTDNTTTITMNSNKTITATFTLIPVTGWTAYNDLGGVDSVSPTYPNVTNYHISSGSGNTGYLINYNTGATLGVSVSVTGGPNTDNTATLPVGSDAYQNFNGKINPNGYIHYSSGAHFFNFTGLDPSKTYRFVHWADRAYPSYNTSYHSTVIISDVTSFNTNSSTGVTISTTTMTDDSASYYAGYNSIRGYVVGFTNINPGADGDMIITVSDIDGKWYSGAFMLQELLPAQVNFTIIALPDTQNYASGYPTIFTNQTQWIVAHKDELNIVWVTDEGDITNGGSDLEFQRADAAYDLLEDPVTTQLTYGIPYTIIQGNHDHATNIFNTYFNYTRFAGRSYYGGHYPTTKNDNNYALFSAGGMDFIAIGIDMSPDTNELAWADTLLQTYSTRRAIVTSHSILNTDGSWTTEGLNIYNALKDNSNLFLMLCGHMHSEARRTDVYNGNTVYSVLSDYQDYTNGGNGYLRIMEFCPATNEIKVKTYSPYVNLYETDANSQFNLTYNMSSTTPPEDEPPVVTLNSPANNSLLTSSSVTFSSTSTDDNDLHNITLYLGSADQGTSGSINVQVSTSSDDAEELLTNGALYLASTDLELGYDSTYSSAQIVGTRFPSVQIPVGATITNAYVEFECDVGTWLGDVPVQITGQDIDSAPTFTANTYDISSRADTTAVVPWTITAQYVVDSKYPSADISSVIQEIVDRPGWSSGNSMVIMFATSGLNTREMEAWDGENAAAPRLVVEYTVGGGGLPWYAHETKTIIGTTNTTTFTITLPDGDYRWNCLVYDDAGHSAFAPADNLFTVTIPTVNYILTTNVVGDGSITPASGSSYPAGTIVPVEAIPDTGYKFVSWSGNLTGTDNTTTITMNSNKTITATFLESLAPTVTLNSPADDSTVTTSTIDFSCTSTDNINLHNVTLFTGQVTPLTPGSINVRVSTGTDDAEEYINDGYTYYTSTDLELGYDDAHSPYSAQIVGTRFNNLQIPQGATITNAYVEFECDVGTWTGDVPLQITGQDIDSAPTFTTTNYDISSRTDTTATVPWTISAQWAVDSKYPSPNISSVIQEIVDRSGWNSGNSMVIMFTASGGNRRETEAYEGESTAAPRLVVEYTTGGKITWTTQETKTISGTTSTATFTVTLADGDYKWNCRAYDEAGNSAFAPSDFDLTVSPPPVYYILTTNVVGNGTVTPASGSSYLAGTVVPVEAIPYSGWQFDHWSGNLSGTDNTTTITMNSNKTITATFVVQPPSLGWTAYNDLAGDASPAPATNYHSGNSGVLKNYATGATLSASVSITGGTNDATGPGTITAGTDAYKIFYGKINPDRVLAYSGGSHVFTFTGLDPSKLYRFVHWGDRADPANTYSSKITISDVTSFTKNSSTGVTISTTVLPDDSATYLTGYNSVNGYVAGFTNINPGSDGDIIITVSGATKWYSNAFMLQELPSGPQPTQYTLTVNKVGNGTVSPASGSTYPAGTVVNVEARPNAGWQFDHWSGNLSGTDNTTTITMDGNKTITATFTELPPVYYILTINKVGNGTVTPPSGNSYLRGTVVPVEAIPDTGWQFSGWSGNLSGTDNTTSITMNSNKTIIATFIVQMPSAGWAAYNDVAGSSVPPTYPNVTNYHTPTVSGALTNYATGATLGVTVAVSGGTDGGGSASTLTPGTDAYKIFYGKINPDSIMWYSGGDHYFAFTGLDPSKTYRFAHWADRGAYTDRFSTVIITDVDSFTTNSSTGVTIGTTTVPNDSATYCTGSNSNGYVAGFTNINPGSDGDITIRVTSSDSTKHQYTTAFMLQELST